MKPTKLLAVTAAAMLSASAFADAANVLISFSTTADYYADGETPVRDGEWYALCWAPEGREFGGFTLDCAPAVDEDRVLILAPLAKNGHCPYSIFQLDSAEVPADAGNYYVYLLDTRDAAGTAVATVAKSADGRRIPSSAVNGAVASKSFTASAGDKQLVSAPSGTAVDGSWAASEVVGANVTEAKISAFKVEDAVVKITVTGMMPGVKYNVQMGDKPDSLTAYALETPKTISDDATFEIPRESANFFKVVRQPLAK